MSREHDAARDAETSSGAPDAVASDVHSDGTADTVAGALSPGSTATSSPTSED